VRWENKRPLIFITFWTEKYTTLHLINNVIIHQYNQSSVQISQITRGRQDLCQTVDQNIKPSCRLKRRASLKSYVSSLNLMYMERTHDCEDDVEGASFAFHCEVLDESEKPFDL